MKSLLKNKKGASVDNIWIIVSFFAIAITFVTLLVFWNALDSVTIWTQSSIGADIKSDAADAVNQFDYLLIMGWLALHIGAIITAYFLRTYPFMYVIGIFMIVLTALVSAPISNAWEDFAADSVIGSSVSSLPMTNYIMTNLPWLEVLWGFMTLVVMLSLLRFEGFV